MPTNISNFSQAISRASRLLGSNAAREASSSPLNGDKISRVGIPRPDQQPLTTPNSKPTLAESASKRFAASHSAGNKIKTEKYSAFNLSAIAKSLFSYGSSSLESVGVFEAEMYSQNATDFIQPINKKSIHENKGSNFKEIKLGSVNTEPKSELSDASNPSQLNASPPSDTNNEIELKDLKPNHVSIDLKNELINAIKAMDSNKLELDHDNSESVYGLYESDENITRWLEEMQLWEQEGTDIDDKQKIEAIHVIFELIDKVYSVEDASNIKSDLLRDIIDSIQSETTRSNLATAFSQEYFQSLTDDDLFEFDDYDDDTSPSIDTSGINNSADTNTNFFTESADANGNLQQKFNYSHFSEYLDTLPDDAFDADEDIEAMLPPLPSNQTLSSEQASSPEKTPPPPAPAAPPAEQPARQPKFKEEGNKSLDTPALIEQIRNGIRLRPVENVQQAEAPNAADTRGTPFNGLQQTEAFKRAMENTQNQKKEEHDDDNEWDE